MIIITISLDLSYNFIVIIYYIVFKEWNMFMTWDFAVYYPVMKPSKGLQTISWFERLR